MSSDQRVKKHLRVRQRAAARACPPGGVYTHAAAKHKHIHPRSLKHKLRPLIQTHRHPTSPLVDQRPWSKTNILTYLFLFYSLRKRPAIWQSPGTDGDCPLPESTRVYCCNLRSHSSKRMPPTGIFPQAAIVIDLRGKSNNETMQRNCFSVQ